LVFTFAAGAMTAVITILLRFQADLHWIPSYLLGINAATFAFYGYDKLISGRKLLRVPEQALHLFAFLGGTPCALLAQYLFRHKTVKRSFRTVFWLLTVVQLAALGWALWYFYWRH